MTDPATDSPLLPLASGGPLSTALGRALNRVSSVRYCAETLVARPFCVVDVFFIVLLPTGRHQLLTHSLPTHSLTH